MEKLYKKIFVIAFVLMGVSCDMDKDLVNPNEISVSGADVNLLVNAIELDFADFFQNAQGSVAPLVRHSAMTGGYRYQTAFQPQNQDGLWYQAYQNILINAETLIPLAKEKTLTTHVAVARILEAYTLMTLVDLFGNVPASQALQAAAGEYNPTADDGAAVYTLALGYLDEARTELAKTGTDAGAALTRDIYYGTSSTPADRSKWLKLANTLTLKAWVNISALPSRYTEAKGKIDALLTANNLINAPEDNFTYKWGTSTVPNSRHPQYNQYYGANVGSAGGYINTQFMFEMFKGKPDASDPSNTSKFTQDPRWRYYFYRQAGSIKQINVIDPKALGCAPGAPPDHYVAGGYPFCIFDPGFYGRDHGDASGTPPDGPTIVAIGVYPAGGKIDNTTADLKTPATSTFASATKRGDGANGAGISPMWMSFYTDYLRAEIASRAGDDAGAKTALLTAVDNSIAQVKAFGASKNQTPDALKIPSTQAYKDAVSYIYDNSSSKLKTIGREMWIAFWGNGIEAYNSYRRTGGPERLQPTRQLGAGPWLRSLVYPAVYVNLNANASQKPQDTVVKVFWDGNPETLN